MVTPCVYSTNCQSKVWELLLCVGLQVGRYGKEPGTGFPSPHTGLESVDWCQC